ncbi:MAG: acyl-CoA dehydrogenase family protein [Bacteroidales bacterium]
MDFQLSEEHQNIRKAVRDFAEREIKPIARQLDDEGRFSTEITLKMGELGLLGISTPADYGGSGMDTLSYIIAVEELARVDGSQAATIAAHNSLGIGPLVYYGTEKQKKKYIPQLCTGEALWAFGLTEPDAGSDSRATHTKAHIENGEWVITRVKNIYYQWRCRYFGRGYVQAVTGETAGKRSLPPLLLKKIPPVLHAGPCMAK